MRWDRLVDDLTAQLDAEEARASAGLVAELTRAERATVTLAARFEASRGRLVQVEIDPSGSGSPWRVEGSVADVADDWVLVVERGRSHLLVTRWISAVHGLARGSAPVRARRAAGLTAVLRRVSAARETVRIRSTTSDLTCRVVAVGADHVDVEVAGPGTGPHASRRRPCRSGRSSASARSTEAAAR
ncbi:hypothetical protein GCM10025865_22150 [Paraoerskovia sediminicola]|uniref:Uncharacterized protein n=1 Tax=Paraoerskovia sediminicola TaxID=1138587 RepID=A0ABM8G4G0_9CELL|nr:hypothetical protein [Paraoerskovia sediminicola]BDZ42916.1 hypothetical protein GCM10025865_22150 [Paraoerskovia sediminicola]